MSDKLLIIVLLSPWFVLGWVALFIALTARKPKRDLDSANDLLRERNEIGHDQAARILSCAYSLERIAECLETLTKEDKP